MFLRQTRRKKDGKTYSYWSVVENQRLEGGRVVQRHMLYLGEISPSQAAAWRKSIEIFDEDAGHPCPTCGCAGRDNGRRAGWPGGCGRRCSWIGSGPIACRRTARERGGIRSCRSWYRTD
jgi:hypothetical protein